MNSPLTAKTVDHRPPIVTIMGHVDHGKTSLLEALLKRDLTAKEVGGITQAVSAHSFLDGGRKITFVDTPGHEAFLAMRRRGGRLADIVLLVVSAEEGVKPQTKEAINQIKETKSDCLVVITKMDRPGADPERVKRELSESGLLVEGLGGEVPVCPVSIKDESSLKKLADLIFLMSDLHHFSGDDQGPLEALVLESVLDHRRGPLVLVVVRSGRLQIGDEIYAGLAQGKIRSLVDDRGQALKACGAGQACLLLGLSKLVSAGEALVRGRLIPASTRELPNPSLKTEASGQGNEPSRLKVILKADTFGSLEALLKSLESRPAFSPDAGPLVVASGVGNISDNDIYRAWEAGAVVIGFRVKVFPSAADSARDRGVEVRTYEVIYPLLEELSQALSGLLAWQRKTAAPQARVLKVFVLPSLDQVLGVKLENGLLKVGQGVVVKRDSQELLKSAIKQLRIGQEKVEKVSGPNECGVLLKDRFDQDYLQAGDLLSVL